MTRQENILTLNEHLDHWKRLLSEKICDQNEGEKTIDALQNAIKALEQDPCEDAVSRQAVLEVIRKCHCEEWVKADIGAPIEVLPSVTPQPKMGRWIDVDGIWFKCSECDAHRKMMPAYKEYYCPNCGRRMQEVEE